MKTKMLGRMLGLNGSLATIVLAFGFGCSPEGAAPVGSASDQQTLIERDGLGHLLFSFDNDPGTPDTRCWYYNSNFSQFGDGKGLDEAQPILPNAVPDSAVKKGIRVSKIQSIADVTLNTPGIQILCSTPVSRGGPVAGLCSNVRLNRQAVLVAGEAMSSIDDAEAKLIAKPVSFESIKLIREAVSQAKILQTGQKCWPANKIVQKLKSALKPGGVQ